jgi:hypothetical protein
MPKQQIDDQQVVDTGAEQAQADPTIEELSKLLDSIDIAPAEQAAPPADESQSQPEPDAGTETSEADEDSPETAKQLTVKDLAAKLDVPVSDIYDQLMVDVGEGQQISIGELKDRGRDVVQADALLAQANETRLNIENDLLVKREAIARYAQRIGYQPTETDLQESQAETQRYRNQQVQKALEIIPGWQDEGTRNKELEIIGNIADEYQFSEAESRLLIDARLLKLFRDYGTMRATMRKLSKSYKRPKQKTSRRSEVRSGGGVTNIRSSVKSGKTTQKDAVDQLGELL